MIEGTREVKNICTCDNYALFEASRILIFSSTFQFVVTRSCWNWSKTKKIIPNLCYPVTTVIQTFGFKARMRPHNMNSSSLVLILLSLMLLITNVRTMKLSQLLKRKNNFIRLNCQNFNHYWNLQFVRLLLKCHNFSSF